MAIKRKINKSKRVSRGCRNNGSCPYCRASRLHNANKRLVEAKVSVAQFLKEKYGN